MARPKKYIYTDKDLHAAVVAEAQRHDDQHRRSGMKIRQLEEGAAMLEARVTSQERKLIAQEKLIAHWQTRAKKWRLILWNAMALEDAVTAEGQNVPFDVANTTHR